MGLVCLQGGAEFTPPCQEMDRVWLAAVVDPRIVVLPAAGAPGREYAVAGHHAVEHFTAIGVSDVTVAPDPRDDPAGARAALAAATVVVLPGGSPRRLRDALIAAGLADVLREVSGASGTAVMGASAGAMVLGAVTVLPERPRLDVGPGLDIAPRLAVVPHYNGPRPAWTTALRAYDADVTILGIPECSGVLLDGATRTALGVAPAQVLAA